MRLVVGLLFGLFTIAAQAQSSYPDSILQHRRHYKEEFLTDEHSPLKAADTGSLRFYAPDPVYRVTATFRRTPHAKAFDMPTHSGSTKQARQYGTFTFIIHDTTVTLQVFQLLRLAAQPKYAQHLFLPFNDQTNYVTTYAGGRYLDLNTTDIIQEQVVLDFNQCYNPYCAYADGYNCPIPPTANRLSIAIPAGEQLPLRAGH